MKQGRTLVELAQELEARQHASRDWMARTDKMEMVVSDREPTLVIEGVEPLGITKLCHRQLGTHTGIPAQYYDRMGEQAPDLLAHNVNTWLHATNEDRLVRALHTNARAFLSSKYRPLDNHDLFEAIMPVFLGQPGIEIVSTEITETRFYVKAVNTRVQADVKVGDAVQAGVVVRNSEVGHGALAIEPLVYRLTCLNGMVVNDLVYRKAHTGKRGTDLPMETDESGVWEYLRDDTKAATDKALWMRVQDLTRNALAEAIFTQAVNRMRDAVGVPMQGDPVEAVRAISKRWRFVEDESQSVLKHLLMGNDLSQFGLANAVTRAAQDVDSYDRSYEMEKLGGEVMALPRREFDRLALRDAA